MDNHPVKNRSARRALLVSLATVIAFSVYFQPLTHADQSNNTQNQNFAMAAAAASSTAPYDVKLSPGTDLLAFTRESQGLAASSYTTPLIIPAAAASADSQSSPYFFSFGSGTYNYSTSSSCHMAPAYLPNSATGITYTVDNFFIFALDNGTADTTYNLYRKNTLNTTTPELMGSVATSGAVSTIQVLGDTTIDNPVVSSSYAYYITWCFNGPSQAIQGFWIYYTGS